MRKIIAGLLGLLILVACGTNQPEVQAAPSFSFSVDPVAGTVNAGAVGNITGNSPDAQDEGAARTLVPGEDLELVSFDFAFLPGNVLAIDAVFKNISGQTLTDLSFSRADSSDNIVSSVEPGAVVTLLPGSPTPLLRFEVTHRGQPFKYTVEADATVTAPPAGDCEGSFIILRQPQLDELEGCARIVGDLSIGDRFDTLEEVIDLAPLSELREVTGDFSILLAALTGNADEFSLEGLENLESVGGDLRLIATPVESLAPLGDLRAVGKEFVLSRNNFLSDLEGLASLETTGSLELDENSSLKRLDGVDNLKAINESLTITRNDALESIDALSNVTTIGQDILIEAQMLDSIAALRNITTINNMILSVGKVTDLAGLENLESVRRNLELVNLSALTNLRGLENLKVVDDNLRISNGGMESLEGLGNLESVGRDLTIALNASLTTITDLSSLTSVGRESEVNLNAVLDCSLSPQSPFLPVDVSFGNLVDCPTLASQADLTLSKASTSSRYSPVLTGEQLTFNLQAKNNGPDTASDVSITARIENATEVYADDCQVSAEGDGTFTVVCDVGELLSESMGRGLNFSQDFSLNTVVAEPGPVTAEVQVLPGTDTDDPDLSNNSAYLEEPAFSPGDPASCPGSVLVRNRTLREGVLIQLQLPQGSELTCEDMAKLETLDFFELREEIDPFSPEFVDVGDLEGLQYAVNLKRLALPMSLVETLAQPLEGLTSLTELELIISDFADDNIDDPEDWENFFDLSPLGTLTNLTYLRIEANHTDFSWINDLTKLERLDLSRNYLIEDVSFLRPLNNLTELDLGGNEIRDISPLASLNRLEELDLFGNSIQSLAPLRDLTSLTSLRVNGSGLDFSDLQRLTNLTSLGLVSAGVTVADIPGSLSKLTHLYIGYSGLSDLSSLDTFTELASLDLTSNNITDISPLASLTKLEELSLRSNLITDIGPLVSIIGLGDAQDRIDLSNNCLDTTQNSQALKDIATIEARNPDVFNVSYATQSYWRCNP